MTSDAVRQGRLAGWRTAQLAKLSKSCAAGARARSRVSASSQPIAKDNSAGRGVAHQNPLMEYFWNHSTTYIAALHLEISTWKIPNGFLFVPVPAQSKGSAEAEGDDIDHDV